MTFTVEPGPNRDMRFPEHGPYDDRLGYAALPSFIERLTRRDFRIERQASLSPRLDQFIASGGYAVYHQKAQTGFSLLDRFGRPLYTTSYPAAPYRTFQSIPPIVVDTLLFIEDRHMLDPMYPRRNPAVEWQRFLLASTGRIANWFGLHLRQGGASTLATQIEKFQHSPGGRTETVGEKFRQMATATLRAYLEGADTISARQQIVTDYLNSTPLSSRPDYGEIIGIGDGLQAWYGTDFDEANRVLNTPALTTEQFAHKAEIYRQVLSLLLAQRRPSYYLAMDRNALDDLTDRYLNILGIADVIDPALYQAALKAKLRFRTQPPATDPISFAGRRAIDAARRELLATLQVSSLYCLDRIDVVARTTIDASAQERVTTTLSRLGDPDAVASLGMVGPKLLGTADPAQVTYSIVLYERGTDRNYVRVHADSADEPFDISSGAKLILGSTAKLRTLITYLDIITELHARYASLPPAELTKEAAKAPDTLSRWAVTYLLGTKDHGLQPMLDAAVERRYSANPGEAFFTGGGRHVFQNFEKVDDGMVPSVAEALEHSINLAFIRLMRDVMHYYLAQNSGRLDEPAGDGAGSVREAYLRRFADKEGRQYLNRFWDDYHGLADEEALTLLASRMRPTDYRLAVAFRSVRPVAPVAALRDFLKTRMPELPLDDAALNNLFTKYGPDRFSLQDRGYLAGIHPLELWLVAYLHDHPHAARSEVIQASTAERQEVYSWLFKTRNARRQDMRIRILLEEDAFNRILQDWRQQGYPFAQLVPSLATAIGSSGDRPDALAQLMGVILNDGMMLPTVDLEHLHFAADTPYETDLAFAPSTPRRVIAPEVARTVRRLLIGVVAEGTGTRLQNVYFSSDGTPLQVGGKTGTGDNRFDTFASGGRLIDSRVVDRTATFAFFLGDRFYGVVTAYVPGAVAENYDFTSALSVQLLKALAPQIQPLIATR